jgi:hypothetical protein
MIKDEEVWLRAYNAALSNPSFSSGYTKMADDAVRAFNKRFPKFKSVSEESKTNTK